MKFREQILDSQIKMGSEVQFSDQDLMSGALRSGENQHLHSKTETQRETMAAWDMTTSRDQ